MVKTKGEELGRRINSICSIVGAASKEERISCKLGATRALKEVLEREENRYDEAIEKINKSEKEIEFNKKLGILEWKRG